MITIRSIRDVIRVLFIYRLRVLAALVFTIIAIVAALFMVTPKYRSEAKLLVTLGRENVTLPVMVQDRPALMAQNFQRDNLIDETALFRSRAIVSKVADRWGKQLSAQSAPQSVFGWIKSTAKKLAKGVIELFRSGLVNLGLLDPHNFEVSLIEDLNDSLIVAHETGGASLYLSLDLNEPELSRQVLNDWISFYLETRLQILNDKSVSNFYEGQLVRTRAELEAIAKDRGKIYARFGSPDLHQRERSISARIDGLQTERETRERSLLAARTTVEESKRKLGRLRNYVDAEIATAENPTIRDFTGKLNNLLMQREDKLRVFSPQSEQVKSLDRSIEEVKSWIREQARYDRSGEVRKINPLVTRSEAMVAENEILASESSALLGSLEGQIANLRAEREGVLNAMDELNELDRRYGVAQRNYELYATNLEKSRIDTELDKSRISNVRVMEPPTYNPIRTKPRTLLLLGSAPLLGMAFAVFVAYLSILVDRRVHDGEKLEALIGVPVLATVPELRKAGEAGAERSRQAVEAALNQLANRLVNLAEVTEAGGIVITALRRGAGVSFLADSLRGRLAGRPGKGAALGVLDAEPIHESEQGLRCLQSEDCIVLVVEAGHTTLPALESGLAALHGASHARVIGVVLNRRPFLLPEWLYQALA